MLFYIYAFFINAIYHKGTES